MENEVEMGKEKIKSLAGKERQKLNKREGRHGERKTNWYHVEKLGTCETERGKVKKGRE